MNQKYHAGMKAPDFRFDTPEGKSHSLFDSLKSGDTLLVFLRYVGCPICQMKIAELTRDFDQFKKRMVGLIVALQSEPETVKKVVGKNGLPFPIACDPNEEIFKLYGVLPGSIFRYITPRTILSAVRSIAKGYRHGKYEGEERQLPAVFLVGKDKKILYAYYGKNVADVPGNKALLKIVEKHSTK